ncbi:hypothetical protein J3R83DRAFT_5634 [Lanmaoa asiatica]|nr:hypothetical protein J3R83DRAFT_5634 [Lanmaoa asiatica]
MFAKLSALALCLASVFALEIQVQDSAEVNTTIPLNFTISASDPSHVDLYLTGLNSSDTYDVANDVAVAPTVYVTVPDVSHPESCVPPFANIRRAY